MPSRQLLAYRFGSDSKFEGQLVGALERIESGGAMRVLDALFVSRDPESGELTAVSLTGGSGGIIGQLLDFRLDPDKQQHATERALGGPARDAIDTLVETLEPGGAIAAVVVEHLWAGVLSDAVARIGGAEIASEFVDTDRVSEVTDRVRTAAEDG